MKQNDPFQSWKEIIVVMIAVASMMIILISIIFDSEQNSSKTEVMGQYKNCDIVRWTDPSMRYQYFLHCST